MEGASQNDANKAPKRDGRSRVTNNKLNLIQARGLSVRTQRLKNTMTKDCPHLSREREVCALLTEPPGVSHRQQARIRLLRALDNRSGMFLLRHM